MASNHPHIRSSSIEDQIHEEEVRYNEAFRMNAEFQVLKSIKQKIRLLKAQLTEPGSESGGGASFSNANSLELMN